MGRSWGRLLTFDISGVNSQILSQLVASRKLELEHLKYEELDALPPYSDNEGDEYYNKKMTIAVWKEKLPTGDIQIVVQGMHFHFLGASTSYAEGFLCSETGELKPLPQDTLWEYQ